ncbi:MAG: nucleotidyltransferase family protein [Planctomycetota bacterium]
MDHCPCARHRYASVMSSPFPHPIQAKLPLAVSACRASGVRRRWVFGSAARIDWREGASDIDFLVELDPSRPLPEQFLGLSRALKGVFGCHVDLVSMGGVKNPHFRAELEETRVSVYAAA